ncbi:hypothetical protein [Isoptericola croceus]|uniref:hypothetical protein n=1 Tax=Isoptericola croceus TaxID=3031406 RepID=UPI0023F9CC07|nr:hypothetical protein [Isoptericola croceus]
MTTYPELTMLTALTGAQADADRPVVVGTVEMSLPFVKAGSVAALPALMLGGLAGAVGGIVVALVVIIIVWGLGIWLLLGRSGGLRQRNLKTLRDRMRYRDADITLCGHPIDPIGCETGFVVRNSLPVKASNTEADSDVVLGLAGRTSRGEIDIAAFNRPVAARPRARRVAYTARRLAVAPDTTAESDPSTLFSLEPAASGIDTALEDA